MVMVGFTFVVALGAGSAGEKVAVPLAFLQVVPPAAPAGEAIKPSGNTIAAASNTPASLRILRIPSGRELRVFRFTRGDSKNPYRSDVVHREGVDGSCMSQQVHRARRTAGRVQALVVACFAPAGSAVARSRPRPAASPGALRRRRRCPRPSADRRRPRVARRSAAASTRPSTRWPRRRYTAIDVLLLGPCDRVAGGRGDHAVREALDRGRARPLGVGRRVEHRL